MSKIYQRWCLTKAKIKLDRLLPFLKKEENILDIGTGNGALSLLLVQQGFNIETTDIKNKSAFQEIVPTISDGVSLPYPDKYFDKAMMITMLHHCQNPEVIVQEALRVSKTLLIMEDIYTNNIQKYITFAADSVNNWEFIGHPHSNKTDAAWCELFKKMNLNITKIKYHPFLLLFKQVTYLLE